MPAISKGDSQIYYERHGVGFPVIFISGLGGLGSFWRDQVPCVARDFEAIVYDHRGVGQSDRARPPYTVDGMARDVVTLMDGLGIERAHLVGHSTGGAIAQILAIDHPERVGSIILAGSWTRADPYFRRLFALRKEILLRLGPEAYLQSATLFLYSAAWIARNNEKLRHLEAQYLATFPPVEIAASRIDAILAFDRVASLGKIRCPTLVIGAADDAVTPAYFSEELARLIPGAELKLFARGGHAFPQVASREFSNAVVRYLQAHTEAERALATPR